MPANERRFRAFYTISGRPLSGKIGTIFEINEEIDRVCESQGCSPNAFDVEEVDDIDDESKHILDAAQPDHWAYKEGHKSGVAKQRAKRGLMRLGLGCAADMETAYNTTQWLAGFYHGIKVDTTS